MAIRGFGGARGDIARSAQLYGVWGYLALSDVVARYRNTILGPIWNSAYLIGQAVAMSFVFGAIFGSDVSQILPYILAGLIGWMFIPATILDSSTLLLSSSGMIKGQTLPYMIYPMRVAMRSMIFLGHNVIAFAIVLPFFGRLPLFNPILFLSVILGALIIVPWALLIGMAAARFRDINQLVANFSPILFFLTPVFWQPATVHGAKRALFAYNPLYYVINTIRDPLLFNLPSLQDWVVSVAFGGAGWLLAYAFLALHRSRIPYWV